MKTATFRERLRRYATKPLPEEIRDFLKENWRTLDQEDPDVQTLIYSEQVGRGMQREERLEAVYALRRAREKYT